MKTSDRIVARSPIPGVILLLLLLSVSAVSRAEGEMDLDYCNLIESGAADRPDCSQTYLEGALDIALFNFKYRGVGGITMPERSYNMQYASGLPEQAFLSSTDSNDILAGRNITGRQGLMIAVSHTFNLPDGSSFTPGIEVDAINRFNNTLVRHNLTSTGKHLANMSFTFRSSDDKWQVRAVVENILDDGLFMNLTDINRGQGMFSLPGSPRGISVGFVMKFP